MSTPSKFSAFVLAALLTMPMASAYAQKPDDASAVSVKTTQVSATEEAIALLVDEGKVIQPARTIASVFVANPNVADIQVKSGNLLYVYGRAAGETSFYAVDGNDKIVASYKVTVGLNLAGIRAAIRTITGDDRVDVSSVRDMIVLDGVVANATVAQDVVNTAARFLPEGVKGSTSTIESTARDYIINRMAIEGSNQVNLRVRIAEVSRDATKTLGISSSVGGRYFGDVDFSLGFDSNVSFSGGAGATSLGTKWGGTSLSAALDALVNDGLATVLAEPNLTALSGETANFLAGGEFPIPVSQDANTVTVEFREFGVRLAFTPTVLSGNRINLRVRPEVSERDDTRSVTVGSFVVPSLRTRRAETSLELGSGQSFALGGLLQSSTSQVIEKMPGVGDIPVLGALFRSDRFIHNETELVIIVTPYLVRPVATSKLMLPTDGFVPPNDIDRWAHGRMNSEVPTPSPVKAAESAPDVAQAGLVGDVGYVLQ